MSPAARAALGLLFAVAALAACNTSRADPLASNPAAAASPTPEVTACNHCATDLEARLPTSIGGTALTAFSFNGEGFLSTGSSANQQQISNMLAKLGKSVNDLSVAQASDPSGELVFKEGILRVAGASAEPLLNAWLEAQRQAVSDLVVTTVAIGGQNVTRLTDRTSTTSQSAGASTYVVPKGDALFLILAEDTKLVDQAVAEIH